MRTGRNTLQGWDSLRSEGPQAGGVPSGPEFGFRAFAAVARVRSLLGELRASKPAMQCDKKKRTKTAATTHTPVEMFRRKSKRVDNVQRSLT